MKADEVRLYALRGGLKKQAVCYTHFHSNKVFRGDRKIIYTTNAVEGYHRMVSKFTKSKSIFPTDDAIRKVVYMSVSEISKKWTMPVRDWGLAFAQFMIYFEDRFAA